MQKDLTWQKLLYSYSDALVKLCLNATTNTLPSPDNLRRWAKAKDCHCGLCGRDATLNHILAGCPFVRDCENKRSIEDRYTWRHNCILNEIAKHVAEFISEVNSSSIPLAAAKSKKQRFIKAVAPVPKRKKKLNRVFYGLLAIGSSTSSCLSGAMMDRICFLMMLRRLL